MPGIKHKGSLADKTLIAVFHYKRRRLAHELGASKNILGQNHALGVYPS
jgi:hypothetical protein